MRQKLLITIVFLFGFVLNTNAQEAAKTKTITIKKGQSLDLFFGNRKPNTDEALGIYFNKVIPPASKLGFKVDGSFITTEPPTRGNFHSDFMSVMSWPNSEARNQFFKDFEKVDYDFTAERRKIWSVFNFVEYSKLEKDINFVVSSDKTYVVTTYWIEDGKNFETAIKNIRSTMKTMEGKLLMQVGKGHSPNGYLYEPDLITITEWESPETFKKFLKSIDSSKDIAGTKNVNQWITQFIFR